MLIRRSRAIPVGRFAWWLDLKHLPGFYKGWRHRNGFDAASRCYGVLLVQREAGAPILLPAGLGRL